MILLCCALWVRFGICALIICWWSLILLLIMVMFEYLVEWIAWMYAWLWLFVGLRLLGLIVFAF